VGVSTPELDDLVHTARLAGAAGAKLTGAGGGGAIIAIAGVHGEEVLRRWRAKGYYGFITTIGHV
jgi:mevalonate kinase